MANFALPHFGEIDITNLEEYYTIDLTLNDLEISVDLNFKNKSIDSDKAESIKNFLEKLSDFDIQNKIYIENDYNDEENDTVKEYLEFHLEEFDKDILSRLIDFEDKNTNPEIQLLNKLKLVRVGLYPDGKYDAANFATYDYTFDRKITDQLIVVNTDENNNLDHITSES